MLAWRNLGNSLNPSVNSFVQFWVIVLSHTDDFHVKHKVVLSGTLLHHLQFQQMGINMANLLSLVIYYTKVEFLT